MAVVEYASGSVSVPEALLECQARLVRVEKVTLCAAEQIVGVVVASMRPWCMHRRNVKIDGEECQSEMQQRLQMLSPVPAFAYRLQPMRGETQTRCLQTTTREIVAPSPLGLAV